ncbi:hypothetical protein DIPPA_02812 [Diplonema papillatum]|nr:hypothetical protein DIPPA_02812 [Diplonema papillatum]
MLGPARKVGVLTTEEKKSSVFSKRLEYRELDLPKGKKMPFGLMASAEALAAGPKGPPIPCALAISGEAQQHVSRFFQSWKPEERNWAVLTPMRPAWCRSLFFEDAKALSLVKAAADHLFDLVNVEGGKLHVIGTSNGGTTCWSFATTWPELVASITVVTGSITREAEAHIQRIRDIPCLQYCGDADELGFLAAMQRAKAILQASKHRSANESLIVLPGAGHFNIGEFIDKNAFFDRLESLRPTRPISTAPVAVSSSQDTAPEAVSSSQDTAPEAVSSSQDTAPEAVSSSQDTAPEAVSSSQDKDEDKQPE